MIGAPRPSRQDLAPQVAAIGSRVASQMG